MDLKQVSALLKADIQESMAILLQGKAMSGKGRLINTLSLNFQGLAICYLLTDSNSEKFQENLIRSGQGRIYYLEKSQQESNTDDRWLSISRSESLFDLIAAGQAGLAAQLADLSTATWKKNNEYEDDFLYISIIQSLILQVVRKSTQDVTDKLNRFTMVLDGEPSGRLDVCNSLIKHDSEAFVDAMGLLMEQRSEKFEKRKMLVASEDAVFWPRNFISTEGLALMNIATLFNLSVPNEFNYCPKSACCPIEELLVPNLFTELDALIEV
jgi:hypothetical protein